MLQPIDALRTRSSAKMTPKVHQIFVLIELPIYPVEQIDYSLVFAGCNDDQQSAKHKDQLDWIIANSLFCVGQKADVNLDNKLLISLAERL